MLLSWLKEHHGLELRGAQEVTAVAHNPQEYGGDIGTPAIDADAGSLEEMMRDTKRVSDALARAGIRHRFGLYDAADAMVGYLHHNWPLDTGG